MLSGMNKPDWFIRSDNQQMLETGLNNTPYTPAHTKVETLVSETNQSVWFPGKTAKSCHTHYKPEVKTV